MISEPGKPISETVPAAEQSAPEREMWGSRLGFVLAAVGSAVGLGNMWRFPYLAAESGGAAFVILYVVMLLFIGVPILLAELAIGRSARLSPIGALKKNGGKGWAPLGLLFVASGFLILSYYSVIAGWTVRYSIDALIGGFPADPSARFDEISSGAGALGFHLLFMLITIGIVMGGIKKGIERASIILMPLLALILLGIAVWAMTLEGCREGYSFYLRPSLENLLDPVVMARAGGQAFFSLSLGMGAMLTYASYLSRKEDVNGEACMIAGADFGIAFVAGLALFPIIAALGLFGDVGESTIGALFIVLPKAFAAMGAVGRVVGILFFVALLVGALTSALSLLEVVTASVMDELKLSRRKAALIMGGAVTLLDVLPALSLSSLGIMDQLAGDLFLVFGALLMAVFVGWRMKGAADELAAGTRPFFKKLLPLWVFLVRFVIPPVLLIVLYNSVRAAMAALGIGGAE
ncbi:MAG: sodium-dependent transporter [Myxococcota bacterium]